MQKPARKFCGILMVERSLHQLLQKVTAEAHNGCTLHTDGMPDVQVMSRSDWEQQRAFRGGHTGDVTAAAWSPNGGLLATSGTDRKLQLWDTKTQKVIKTYDDIRATILAMVWHPTENVLSYTNNDGELYIHTDFVPAEHMSILEERLQPAPFIHDPLRETSGNARRPLTNGVKDVPPIRRPRAGSPDSLDEILGDAMSEDGFIVDDDGAGYAEHVNGHGKRPNGHLDSLDLPNGKRHRTTYSPWQRRTHTSFQPGSTPWRGNRRYLCLNLTGFVWTVDQETHHTVTVEFYDREFHRDFHFTDPFLYDKACLNEHGTLFSCPASTSSGNKHPALLYYRPHETWTARTDWRTELPAGEEATSIALSESYVVVTTSANYVRVFTLFGVPFRVYRQKASPAVTCAAWRDYVLTVGNGPVIPGGHGDNNDDGGSTQLLYTIENVRRDEVCQANDILALPPDAELRSVFFSDAGDPCIYDSTGTLLVLQHWRTPGQARWVPLLDTRRLARLASGRKEERYWPVAVAQEKFHCIILKGGDMYPYFPRPLLSEFEFEVPVSGALVTRRGGAARVDGEDEDVEGEEVGSVSETQRLEEAFLRHSVLFSLLEDLTSVTRASHSQRVELSRRAIEIDKTLLQLLAAECREGEDRGMKALEIVGLMRDRSGRMMEAAGKVAARFGRDVLGEKIREVAERRLVGLDDGEDET